MKIFALWFIQILVCFWRLNSYAVPGDLIGTTTTDIGGTQYGGGGDVGYCMVVQADRKVILIGSANDDGYREIALARYNPNGGLDTTFNGSGIVKTVLFGTTIPYAACQQSDGKIVVVGESGTGAVILRYHPNGSLDTSFNSTGWLVITNTGFRSGRAVAIQGDGKIVVAMEYVDGGNVHWLALLRCNANGTPDTGFGGSGTGMARIPTSTLETFYSSATGVAILPDGKILLAGYGNIRFQSRDFELARFNSDGTWDFAFGVVSTDFGNSDDQLSGIALQSDGKVILSGTSSGNFALARLNVDGTLDTTFNGTGKTIADFGGNSDYNSALILQGDGKIVASGSTNSGGVSKIALARWNTNGTLDASFSGTGKVTTALSSYAIGTCLALQADGDFAVGGYANAGSAADFVLARYEGGSLTALETWRLVHFHESANTGQAADNADPYHTRIPNLTAYAFGLEPALARPWQLPQFQATGGNSTLTFTQPANVTGITYGAEWSTTLQPGDWHSIADIGSGIVHTFTMPTSGSRRLFMRLKISNP